VDRRTLFTATGVLALTAATGAPARAAAPEAVRGPMFSWTVSGGFVPPGVGVLAPPPLVVYDGGLAITEADRALDLSRRAERDLLHHAVEVIKDRRNSTRRPGAPIVADVPFDDLNVHDEKNNVFTASLEGWVLGRDQRIFPAPMYALYDHVSTVCRKVRREGKAFRRDAVLLVAVHLDVKPDDAKRWPDGVPLPAVDAEHIYRERKLRGRDARAVRRLVARAGDGMWPHYRTGDGKFVSVNWRYLLPHE
jgi:hypothetical protein